MLTPSASGNPNEPHENYQPLLPMLSATTLPAANQMDPLLEYMEEHMWTDSEEGGDICLKYGMGDGAPFYLSLF